ncbi:hypothetical protein VZT92_016268 [Zoarces viviparus]|uniref:Uncharacterized protein n=1 Tax=Zoarces viviparus TaxID=48416 RepID=A0AAW1ETR9_ZOAVI
MCSAAEIYWQKENHHKVKRKEPSAPSNRRVSAHMLSTHACDTQTPSTLCTFYGIQPRRTEREASMWDKQHWNNSRPAQWLEEQSQKGHKFKILEASQQHSQDATCPAH